ncbi:MAG: enoyl-CoA hydratase [Gammaproteobacteria bacterium]|nr:enoyl-CoA hydratase [Gammaproteobacteria bacterium]
MTQSAAATLETTLSEGILTIRMNRPAKKNALTGDMYAAFVAALERAEHDSAVRCVVVCGVQGVFSAGNDLDDFLATRDADGPRPAHRLLRALATATVPLVAAVDGVAIGIGTTLLFHCDFVYATPAARFSLPFVNLGLCPEAGSSLLLPRLGGYHHAARLLMLGDAFDAEEAARLGLVQAIYASEEVEARALATAARLAAKPRRALRTTKALLKRAEEPVVTRIEVEIERFNELLTTPAAREIMRAFLDKRAPDPRLID